MKCLITIVFLLMICNVQAQFKDIDTLLVKLQSITEKNDKAKNFAKLYKVIVFLSIDYLKKLDEGEQQFIIDFEKEFLQLFTKPSDSFVNRSIVTGKWENYFNAPIQNELQYQFIGLNTHINGDMWFAIQQLPYDSIVKYKKVLSAFQQQIDLVWDSIYSTTLQYKKIGHLHKLSFGLSAIIGKRTLLKWRNSAIEIALLYTENKKLYLRKSRRQLRKMSKYNRLALKWIR